MRLAWLVLLVAGCSDPAMMMQGPDDAGPTMTGDGPAMRFAVVGDSRPGNLNDGNNYPAAIVQGNFQRMQDMGLQFAVATGDYMFANYEGEVGRQVDKLLASEAPFTNPIYRALGNHECTGATASNCPALNETANIQAYMTRLVPPGVTQPYFRIDVDTPHGMAKFVFVAANAWSSDQDAWLRQQLADKTAYTFVIRHEPPDTTETPGVTPSEAIIKQFPVTQVLCGHSHSYYRVDALHVVSGNGGAPIRTGPGGTSYGFLLMEQQDDGSITATEIDEATGNKTDTWRINAQGKTL
jgi:hypothetical protein